jgi:hypothetical protein
MFRRSALFDVVDEIQLRQSGVCGLCSCEVFPAVFQEVLKLAQWPDRLEVESSRIGRRPQMGLSSASAEGMSTIAITLRCPATL